ncbi:MAG: hypothetical protein ACHQXA_04530 [Gemmatimonadales bacterium]
MSRAPASPLLLLPSFCLVIVAALCACPLAAQQHDSTARPIVADSAPIVGSVDSSVVRAPVLGDTIPPISPMGALLRSMLIPGWGQATLGRKLTGGMMVAWEGVTLGMTIKTSHELAYYENTNDFRIHAKEQERQDWLVLLVFNHLFSGLEAYVSAHLWDFPPDLRFQVLPHGGVGASFTLPLPR